MASTMNPQPGDLIEIFREKYEHWAVYIGNGFVIHLADSNSTSSQAQTGVSSVCSMNSVMGVRAMVKMEKLYKVVGNDEYQINNLLDKKYKPRNPCDIVKDAQSRLGQKRIYCIFSKNCEHFATELRYGKSESRQVPIKLIGGILIVACVVPLAPLGAIPFALGMSVLTAAAAGIFRGWSKAKKNNQ